jgi:hypothetical protein
VTDSVSGYRTLAQLGAGSGVPAYAQGTAPAYAPMPAPGTPPTGIPATPPVDMGPSPQLDASPPPTPIARPTWQPPVDDRYGFEPYDPKLGDAAQRSARTGATPDLPGYGLPVFGLRLPGVRQTIDTVGNGFLDFHPRDPMLRLTGEHQEANPQPPAGAVQGDHGGAPGDAAATSSDGGERSGLAKGMMIAGIGGGFLANAVDIARTIKKYPEALRAAKFDPSLGRLGRLPTAIGLTAAMRPDARLVDPMAPRIATVESLGKSFTRVDEIAMKSSVLLGTSLAALQLASAVPNLADAMSKDGPWYQNIAQSTSGRAGVLQLAGGGLGLGVFLTALHQTKGAGATGIVDRGMAAAKAPVMAKPVFTTVGLASGALVMANELGYLDFLNTGETRSVPTVLSDAAHKTPVLNDSSLRTGALLTAGGVLGYKMQRAINTAGGLSGLSKGHLIGGAVVAGLLGAQLLGGLDVLNKPAES